MCVFLCGVHISISRSPKSFGILCDGANQRGPKESKGPIKEAPNVSKFFVMGQSKEAL